MGMAMSVEAETLRQQLNSFYTAHEKSKSVSSKAIKPTSAKKKSAKKNPNDSFLAEKLLTQRILNRTQMPSKRAEYYPLAEFAVKQWQRGQKQTAIALYHALIQQYPQWPRPKLDLALIYKGMGENAKARELLEQELDIDAPESVQKGIVNLLRAIKAENPWSYDVDFSISPDDNINNATFNEVVTIFGLPFQLNDDSKPKSDIALKLSGNVGYNYKIDQRQSVSGKVDGKMTRYWKDKDIGSYEAGAQVTYANRIAPRQRISVTYRNNHSYTREDHVAVQNSLAATHYKGWDNNCWVSWSPKVELGKDLVNDSRSYQDYSVNTSFSPCIKSWWMQLGGSRHKTDTEAYNYKRAIVGLGTTLLDKPAVTWRANVSYSISQYDGTSFGIAEEREDKKIEASTTLALPKVRPWKYFYPSLTVKYSRNKSNYEFYDNVKKQAYFEWNREY
jgi:hypothetical protein